MHLGQRPSARSRRPATFVVLFVLALAVSAGPSTAHAQRFFAGWELGALDVVVPTLGGQVGVTLVPHVQARITVDDFAFVFFQVGADALYTSAPPRASPSWYVGGGPQAYTSPVGIPGATGPFAAFGLHLTGGLTFPTGPNTATYVEIQPATDLGFHGILVGLRAGVDYAF